MMCLVHVDCMIYIKICAAPAIVGVWSMAVLLRQLAL